MKRFTARLPVGLCYIRMDDETGSKAPELDDVFKALGEPTRREILDILAARPGLTVNELAEHFPTSRYAIRKHLLVLEKANLISYKWDRPAKKLYMNAIPIQMIYDRWISEYSRYWARGLTSLKYDLENAAETSGENETMSADSSNESQNEVSQVYVVYIKTTSEKLWEALQNPEFTRQYYMGMDIHMGAGVNEPIEYVHTGEQGEKLVRVYGQVLEIEPLKKLVHTFNPPLPESGEKPPETTVTYEIEEMGAMTKLTVTHTGFGEARELFTATQEGWALILNGLKSLLETGEGLPMPG